MFLVPNEVNSTTAVNPDASFYEVGSNITLTCSINYFKSSYIDVETTIYIEWIYKKSINKSLNHDSLHYTIKEINLSDAGQYSCLYYITLTVSNPNILPSEDQFNTINIFAISKF